MFIATIPLAYLYAALLVRLAYPPDVPRARKWYVPFSGLT